MRSRSLSPSLPVLAVTIALLSGTSPPPGSAQEAGTYGHYTVYDRDNPPISEYVARRRRLLLGLGQREGMLLLSAPSVTRSNDIEYEYRQNNNLLYFTGITEPESALLVLREGMRVDDTVVTEILFVAERNPTHEVWEGIRMGPEVASLLSGVAVVRPRSELPAILQSALGNLSLLYAEDPHGSAFRPKDTLDASKIGFLNLLPRDSLPVRTPVIRNAARLIYPLREIKSEVEIALMQRAVDASIEGHRRAMRSAYPGIAEYQLEAEMEYAFLAGGGVAGYPSIVGSGPNSCILHYSSNRRTTEPGDLVLMDCGAEYLGYAADITRTFPVNGRFTPEQREIYELVLRAQTEAIDECRPGREFVDPHRRAQEIIAEGLVELGIIENEGEVRAWTLHFTSHLLGLDVHDVGGRRVLQEGMVLTVEPGIYIPAGSRCDPKWWNIGVRIEDDILVTDDDPINLSAALERTVKEIESLVGSNR